MWILRKVDGRFQILLQKRASGKSSYPGCYDISSAGHIPAGVDYIPSALRELSEELGIDASADELSYVGIRTIINDEVFFGKEFHDRQVSKVFVMWRDISESAFTLQKEEVDSVLWIDFDECVERVKANSFKHCISSEELDLTRKYLSGL